MAEFELRLSGTLTEESARLLRALFESAPAPAPIARVEAAPGAVASAPARRRRWPEAAIAIVREAWPQGVPTGEICDRLSAIGFAIPRTRIPSCAARLGLTRPEGSISPSLQKALLAKRQQPASRAPVPTPPALDAPAALASPLAPAPAAPPAPAAVAASAPPSAPSADHASFATIARWAAERGLPFSYASDLPRVNAKRHQLGLPSFVISPGRRDAV